VLYGGRIVSHCLEKHIVDVIVTKTVGMVKFQSFKRKIGRCKLRADISIEANELTDTFSFLGLDVQRVGSCPLWSTLTIGELEIIEEK
jgi:hypothetical protein